MNDTITGSQGQLFIDDGGPSESPLPPVVFVHSAAGSTAHWRHQLAHLRRTRRAVAFDLRGHGRSQRPAAAAAFGIAAMADDVAAVASALALPRFVLCGHSMGGLVAIAYAGAHPARVAGLLLLDPATDARLMPAEVAAGLMQGLRSDGYDKLVDDYWGSMLTEARPAVRDELMRDVHACPREVLVEPLGAMLTFDPVTPLAAFAGPKLAIITPLNQRPDALHALVPAVPHRTVTGTGHWLQLDEPARVNALIDEFLAPIR